MTTYIDERGPYMLELISNADARRRNEKSLVFWSENMYPSKSGRFAYSRSEDVGRGHRESGWRFTILFLPHKGEGEPRP